MIFIKIMILSKSIILFALLCASLAHLVLLLVMMVIVMIMLMVGMMVWISMMKVIIIIIMVMISILFSLLRDDQDTNDLQPFICHDAFFMMVIISLLRSMDGNDDLDDQNL